MHQVTQHNNSHDDLTLAHVVAHVVVTPRYLRRHLVISHQRGTRL